MDTVLRRERIKRGWTQAQVAAKVFVAPSMIQMMETGQRKGSVGVWDALEALFKIPQQELRKEAAGDGKK